MKRAQTFVPALLLGFGVLMISGMREQYAVPPQAPMSTLPTVFQGLEGKDLVVSDEERAVAGMSDYMMRQFGPDSAYLFSVYVGYYDRQVQGKSIHSPKNCLPGAGWDVLKNERISIPAGDKSVEVTKVMLANKGVRALVYYWYQGRGRVEASEYRVKWDLLRDAALYGRTEEALVRVIVPVDSRATGDPTSADGDAVERADALARRVASDLTKAVTTVMPDGPFLGTSH